MLFRRASQPPSPLRHDLRAITGDGVAYSVMMGSGEAYLAAFVLALGFSDVMAGLMSTVPLLAGAVPQTISPHAVRILRSNKRWVVACVATQTLSFVPLIIAALIGTIPAWALFAIAALHWGSGMGAGPAWNIWVGQLIPVRLRASHLGNRARSPSRFSSGSTARCQCRSAWPCACSAYAPRRGPLSAPRSQRCQCPRRRGSRLSAHSPRAGCRWADGVGAERDEDRIGVGLRGAVRDLLTRSRAHCRGGRWSEPGARPHSRPGAGAECRFA
jgi:hypothetical protein